MTALTQADVGRTGRFTLGNNVLEGQIVYVYPDGDVDVHLLPDDRSGGIPVELIIGTGTGEWQFEPIEIEPEYTPGLYTAAPEGTDPSGYRLFTYTEDGRWIEASAPECVADVDYGFPHVLDRPIAEVAAHFPVPGKVRRLV